jgi:Txe/YoeB family toxin of Txe-Axe toxin-antitoxin module
MRCVARNTRPCQRGAWDNYLWWQAQDRKVPRRIDALIKDITRNGNDGLGKPEPLKYGCQGTFFDLSLMTT